MVKKKSKAKVKGATTSKHTPAEITPRKQSKVKPAIISPPSKDLPKEQPEDHQLERYKRMNRKLVKGLLRKRDRPGNKFIRMIVHLIHHGNIPETACRALGVTASVYKAWVFKGFEDIQSELKTQYAKFVSAVDIAMAQEETVAITKIHAGARDWQAIAWGLERKAFKRWGPKHVHMQSDITELGAATTADGVQIVTPDVAGDIMAVLEESGALPALMGAPDEKVIDITGAPLPSAQPVEADATPQEAETAGSYEETEISAF